MTTVLVAGIDLGWRKHAACQAAPPEEFFPSGRPSVAVKEMCKGCPVRSKCFETAVTSPWRPHGVWAGLSGRPLVDAWRNGKGKR